MTNLYLRDVARLRFKDVGRLRFEDVARLRFEDVARLRFELMTPGLKSDYKFDMLQTALMDLAISLEQGIFFSRSRDQSGN